MTAARLVKNRRRLAVAAALACLLCGPAHALRPFQGTDAAVAEPGTFELEAGVARLREANRRESSVPELVGNWGVGHGSEIVLEGKLQDDRVPGFGSHASLSETALSLKHVWRNGALQDAPGLSVASECGVLLPEVHGSTHTGFSCAAIASNRWDLLELHVNAGLVRTREHSTGRELSLIAEAPEEWKIRPVAEAAAERDSAGERSRSLLLGVIIRVGENSAVDVGVRHGKVAGEHVDEVRAGLTWSFDRK